MIETPVVSVRLGEDLRGRAGACAERVGDSLNAWALKARAGVMRGTIERVVIPDALLLTTRKKSGSIKFRDFPEGTKSDEIKRCLVLAVLHVEAIYAKAKPPAVLPVEGRDYILPGTPPELIQPHLKKAVA